MTRASSSSRDEPPEQAWHALHIDEVRERLGGADEGLGEQEIEARRQRYGPNRLPQPKRPGLAVIIARQFQDPLIYILAIAALVSLAISNVASAGFIGAVLLVNSAIGAFQEWRAEGSAEALQDVMRLRTQVLRGGRRLEVDSQELVPGDLVLVEAGAAVPADIRLIEARRLQTDESMLTGESLPVAKEAEAELGAQTPLAERSTLLHAGSAVLNGSGRGLVCRTGAATEIGRIAESLARDRGEAPPLVIKLQRFTRRIAVVVLAAIALLSAVQLWQGADPLQIFFVGVALAVSAIPAGLPVAITVAMSIATHRLALRHVIVRQLPAVEGLGSCTLVASDKTGTLTANALTVKRLHLPGAGAFEVGGEGDEPRGDIVREDGDPPAPDAEERIWALARTGALCNAGELRVDGDAIERTGDSVDVAFLVLAAKLGLTRDRLLDDHPELGQIPFESERRFAASFNKVDGRVEAHVKGAAQTVTSMCHEADGQAIAAAEETLAGRGYRVLALARGEVAQRQDGDYRAEDLEGLELLGLAALIDPVRPEVPDAIQRCHKAGVEVRMITGDHPQTGLAIARELGIADAEGQVVTGNDLRDLEEDAPALAQRIAEARVFARIEPTQKTEVVKHLQAGGHFVAVTGDGVNDAPALKAAHIGVAMGAGGTDVARDAAALILTDDNFASIVAGIEEGRGAYDNVRKVTWLLLATGAAEVLLFVLAILTGLPLPLSAVQLLWLNLVTNGIQDVALAFEKVEPGVLRRPPRPPQQPVFDRQMIRQVLLSGAYIGTAAFAVYWLLLGPLGMGEQDARNVLLLLMVQFENAHVFSCRSETRSLMRVPLRANPWIVLAVIGAHGVHISAMFTPGLSQVLEISPVTPAIWLALLPLPLSLLLFDEMAKWLHRRSQVHGSDR